MSKDLIASIKHHVEDENIIWFYATFLVLLLLYVKF